MGAKTHCGYCGTIENGLKTGHFLRFFHTFCALFDGFCALFVYFLVLSDAFISRLNNSRIGKW